MNNCQYEYCSKSEFFFALSRRCIGKHLVCLMPLEYIWDTLDKLTWRLKFVN